MAELKQTDLKTLVKQVKELSRLATQGLEGVDPRMRPGRENQKRQAQDELGPLKTSYKQALNKAAVTIFVNGPGANQFAILAHEAGAVVVDYADFYENLAKRCFAALGARQTFGLTQYTILISELRMLSDSQNWDFKFVHPTPLVNEPPCSTLEQTVGIVKELVESVNGTNLVKRFLEDQALSGALKEELDSKVIPVVVLNSNKTEQESLIGTLFRGKGLTVDTDDEVTQQTITKTFEQIKKLLKGN